MRESWFLGFLIRSATKNSKLLMKAGTQEVSCLNQRDPRNRWFRMFVARRSTWNGCAQHAAKRTAGLPPNQSGLRAAVHPRIAFGEADPPFESGTQEHRNTGSGNRNSCVPAFLIKSETNAYSQPLWPPVYPFRVRRWLFQFPQRFLSVEQ
jgi:hypothetical protein